MNTPLELEPLEVEVDPPTPLDVLVEPVDVAIAAVDVLEGVDDDVDPWALDVAPPPCPFVPLPPPQLSWLAAKPPANASAKSGPARRRNALRVPALILPPVCERRDRPILTGTRHEAVAQDGSCLARQKAIVRRRCCRNSGRKKPSTRTE
jgi:hypothetical protein